ncbi:MAG: rod shape-determining protein RodA [Deltaproteobacteria bacterium]|nr:rod shape-determining protein RodA [Deltaproteobacteria bacterium]
MTSAETRLFRHVPWHVVLLAAMICALGVWNLASASGKSLTDRWLSQAELMGAGAVVMAAICLVDYRVLMRLAYPIYAAVVLMLVGVTVHGKVVMGARRWLQIGPLQIQPSEFAKLAIILALARWFHEDKTDADTERRGYSLQRLWQPFLMLLVPVILTLKQPDLGTAMLIAAIALSCILFAKVRWRSLAVLGVVGLLGVTVAFTGIPTGHGTKQVLKDYQRKRLLTFLNPEGDALGAGYHANQSMIAVGSGQLSGKGWGQGTQTQLSFLPEQHTDFIFSVWAEEQGFLGAMVLLALYMVLILSGLSVAYGARERFGAFLAFGIVAMIFWHVFINIGMVTGTLPVVGVPLPLMSYGRSSVLTFMVGLGLLLNVQMRRFNF